MPLSGTNLDPLNSMKSPRRRVFGLGLQARLILAFLAIISAALGLSGWLFAGQSNSQLTELMAQQARLVAYTLSQSAEPTLAHGDKHQLEELGRGLMDTRSVMYVGFLDANCKPLALTNRYADFKWSDITPIDPAADTLQLANPRMSSTFGEYVDVYAPIFSKPDPHPVRRGRDMAAAHIDGPKKIGYVIVGVSLEFEQAQLRAVNRQVGALGVCMVLVSMPLAYLVVFSIFKPIRMLVDATRKLANGRTDFRVASNRNDLIGELSKSFEEMVAKIRRQREDLASANGSLERTNTALATVNTELATVNAKLSDANRDLENKVRDRTEQLETANRRLSGEIAEKEDFLRAVSHDLNAPLRNISGMATMLLNKCRDKFDADVIHRLERIQKNVQVETDLISELLELSRIKSRRQTTEPIDLQELVNDLAGVFEQDLQSREIELMIDTNLPLLIAEKARMRQVFQNLIDNAIKYMGDGPRREIHIGARVLAAEAEFYVRDTGIGIEPDDIGKVFNVFRRGKSAAVQNIPGKGVGLSSVKSIIETYSGSIWVESKPGEGTTFKFTINGKHVGVASPPESGGDFRRAA